MVKSPPRKTPATQSRHFLATEGRIEDSKYFFFEAEPNDTQELTIVFGGYEKCASDYEIKRKTYPYYILEFPLRGQCQLTIQGRSFELKKGTLAGFAPGTPHHYRCEPKNPMEHIFIAFTGLSAKALFQKSTLLTHNHLILSKPGESLYLAEAILQKGLEKTEYSQHLCCCYLRALLLEQAANLSQLGQASSISKATYQTCRKYIDDHFSLFQSPADVAEMCGINIRYLSRLFKKYSNTTTYDYITGLKMNKAASLLLISNFSINQISKKIGFEDPYHFSRNFKKFHGLSPKHYRNKHV